MVAGRRTTERDKDPRQPIPGAGGSSATGPAPPPVSVSAISSTSFFDSPHFSRRQPYKSMPVPVSSEVPPPEHGEGAPRGYRHPPPGYGAHYSPYGYPPSGHHYAPPHGYSPHHGGPPPGYPHHHPHSHPSAYSPPPGYAGRSVYGYGGAYEGSAAASPSYPMQQSRESRSKSPFQRGRSSGDSVSGNRSTASASQRASPVAGARRDVATKSSPEQKTSSASAAAAAAAIAAQQQEAPAGGGDASSAAKTALNHRSSPTKLADDLETERLRQAALEDISPSQVEPIKTAFHFFVMDMRESMRPMAEEEVRRSISAGVGQPLDPYLVNSNLNCRLIKAWEDLNDESRHACMRKEEEDRRRFMEEEEIASRHCATLTARSKSPKTPERRSSTLTADSRATPNPSPTSLATNPEPSPSPISRLTVAQSASLDNDEKKVDDSNLPHSAGVPSPIKSVPSTRGQVPTDDGANKRPSPSKQDEKGGSPPKRNRLEEEESAVTK